MPIRLITGTPGAGKTLLALEQTLIAAGINPRGKSLEQIRAHLQNPENPTRPIYVCNVRGLLPGLFDSIETPWEWQDCPDGSLILVDEAWEFFGKHLRNADDPRILELAKHRHRGFDFIWTTQAPGQLTPFVRDLLGEHEHVTRKFGTQTTFKYTWPHVVDSPNGQTAKAQAIEEMWQYPKEVFALYESATLHTVKRKIPKKLIAAGVAGLLALVAIPGAAVAMWYGLTGDTAAAAEAAKAGAPEARSAASTEGSRAEGQHVTSDEYAMLRTPRIPADPASAPLYDGFEVRDYPRLHCVIVGDQMKERITCNCYTQQVTPLNVDDGVCISIARNGYWDPRREPFESKREQRQEVDQGEQEGMQSRDSPQANGIGGGIDRSLNLPYTPPEFQGVGIPSGIPSPSR